MWDNEYYSNADYEDYQDHDCSQLNRKINEMKTIEMSDIIKKYKQLNPEGNWFDKDMMSFFKSHLPKTGYESVASYYFISSEQDAFGNPRRYTICALSKLGPMNTIGDFRQFTTRLAAKNHLTKLLGV